MCKGIYYQRKGGAWKIIFSELDDSKWSDDIRQIGGFKFYNHISSLKRAAKERGWDLRSAYPDEIEDPEWIGMR